MSKGFSLIFYRYVAQLVARLLWEQDAAGSSPVIPTSRLVNSFYLVYNKVLRSLIYKL